MKKNNQNKRWLKITSLSKLFVCLSLVFALHSFSIEKVHAVNTIENTVEVKKEESLEKLQQQKTVTGKVSDTNGISLPGVSVLIVGTNKGTITDVDGNYNLSDVSSNSTLQFSFIGMLTQDIVVGNKTTINVELQEETFGLDEVIVIGYGTARREDFTGSVSSLNVENSAVSLLPNTNALESLKGNISGLNIGASNSAGQEPSMLIRS